MITLRRYSPSDKEAWDAFVENSKNGTFLHKRDYMDYHADRFQDFSLIVFRDDKLYALFPACADGDDWVSHAGLTYGGMVMGMRCTAAETLEVFGLLCAYIKKSGFRKIIYSPVPHIYHTLPSEEDLYAIFRMGGVLSSRKIASVVDAKKRLKWRNIRKAGVRKAEKDDITIEESHDFPGFWSILEDNLSNRYGAHPVHTLEEIQYLHSKFPDNILLHIAKKRNKVVAGTVIYKTERVAHCQYISANEEGKRAGALDLLFHRLLNEAIGDESFFDFGTSNENAGKYLNETLIYQKEGFGGRAICYDTYTLSLT